MVTAILVMFVISLLVATMMYTNFHNANATAKNRSWGQSIHVAESGVQQAIAVLQSTGGVAPTGTVTGTTADGTYQYHVTVRSRNRYQIDAAGTVGTVTALQGMRRLRVMMAPPQSFNYALFSLSDVTTKNNNVVCGDIWANTYVTVYQNDSVLSADSDSCPDGSAGTGSVTAATGSISLEHNSRVDGDAWSGGNDTSGDAIALAGGASIGGFVKASSSAPGCSDDPGHSLYSIVNSGSITGSVTTWGANTGSGPAGARFPLTCTAAAPTKTHPRVLVQPGELSRRRRASVFVPHRLQRVQHLRLGQQEQPLGRLLHHGWRQLHAGQSRGRLSRRRPHGRRDRARRSTHRKASGLRPATLTTRSSCSRPSYAAPATNCSTNGGNPGDCAIGIKNNFQPVSGSVNDAGNTAVLLYAPNGPVAFKNNADFLGAVYANNIQVKNNMNVIYDPRVSQIVGFGTVTLDITRWLECTPGSVTNSSC